MAGAGCTPGRCELPSSGGCVHDHDPVNVQVYYVLDQMEMESTSRWHQAISDPSNGDPAPASSSPATPKIPGDMSPEM